jgi:uncharacterized protein (DUF58 family)
MRALQLLVRRRPTRRGVTILFTGGLLLLTATTAQAGWVFVLAAGVLALVPSSLLASHRVKGIDVTRGVPSRVRCGDLAPVVVQVGNRGPRRTPEFRLEEQPGAFEGGAFVFESLGPGEVARAQAKWRAQRRGTGQEANFEAVMSGPFGLLSTRRSFPGTHPMTVVPRWVELPRFPLLERSSPTPVGARRAARAGGGAELYGVRDYNPGDPPRSVHWRAVARTRRLMVRELEEEIKSEVAVVVHGIDAGDPPDSAFEAVVAAAASVCRYCERAERPVALVHDGSAVATVPFTAALDRLADVAPSDGPLLPLAVRAGVRVGPGGTVVLCVTGAGDCHDLNAALHRIRLAGARTVAIVADASSWSPETAPVSRAVPAGAARVLRRGKDLADCLGT